VSSSLPMQNSEMTRYLRRRNPGNARRDTRFPGFQPPQPSPVITDRVERYPSRLAIIRRSGEKPFVVVTANPKPGHCHFIHDANGPASKADSGRPDGLFPIDALEMKRRMERVLFPEAISLARSLPQFIIQGLVCLPKGRQCSRLHNLR
jgi:hypothetical protein